MATTTGELRETLRGMIDAQIEGTIDVDLDELVAEVQDRFRRDGELQDLLVREALPMIVVTIAQKILHERRVVDELMNPRQQAASIFENVGQGHYRPLLAMTRRDLLYAAEQRERQAHGHLKWARLERELAGLLPDDSTVVGDFFIDRDDDLGALLDKHLRPRRRT